MLYNRLHPRKFRCTIRRSARLMKNIVTVAVLAALVALLSAVPWLGSAPIVQFGINALLIATLAQGWNIIGGYTGYASFGNSVFYGLGTYGTAIAMANYHLPFGAGLVAIRENEDAAAVMGINTTLYKVLALALAGFFSALAGGIHAYWITFIDPSSAFDSTLNVKMVIMAVFGGPGTVFGPVIGAFLLSGISELLASNVSTVASLFYGLVIVLAVVFMPKGLIDMGGGVRRLGWKYFIQNIRQNRL